MIYFGIDPGRSGAIAALWDDGVPVSDQMRLDGTDADVAGYLRQFDLDNSLAVIEKVHAMPKQGVSSTFKFGDSCGFLRGLLVGLQIKHVEVTPQAWQKAMACLTKGDKNVSKQKAQQLWPRIKITHRNADALLIAEYARRFVK